MKNPWMSMWLSAANKAAGPVRGFWKAEAKRQQTAFLKEMSKAAGVAASGGRRAPQRRAK